MVMFTYYNVHSTTYNPLLLRYFQKTTAKTITRIRNILFNAETILIEKKLYKATFGQ